MENALANKAKFFAQYWGQIVAVISKGSYTHPKGTLHVVDKNTISSVESENFVKHKYSLELKPLSSISDEDFLEVMCMIFPFQPRSSFKKGKFYIDHLNINQADFLRSKGYAIPWMGLSVEEQVNRCWVKLKGETK